MDNRRIVVIGSGIAALSTIFELNKNGFDNILCISSDSFAPNCSYTSTGINALRGTESGLSPLGDTLIASHEAFSLFNEMYRPIGVTRAREIHCWQGENAKLLRRYKTFKQDNHFDFFSKKLNKNLNYFESDAYIISPDLILKWFRENSSFDSVDDFVVDIKDTKVIGHNDSYCFDHLIICSGFLAMQFINLVDDVAVRKNLYYSKPVSGSYVEFDLSDFVGTNLNLENSFSFVFENCHLIYRKDSKKVIIGSTSQNNKLNLLANKEELIEKYEKLKVLIGGEFPSFEDGYFYSGVRHKTQNREPFWGEINPNISAIWGLYKTGWSMSFLASKTIATLLVKGNKSCREI
jgi:glycine/D-amino acid oxidase-like deaminating enzyme